MIVKTILIMTFKLYIYHMKKKMLLSKMLSSIFQIWYGRTGALAVLVLAYWNQM